MKKLLLLLALIIITSCSTSDDDKTVEKNYFNPPVWIQGTWKEPKTGATFTFTRDNVICNLNKTEINFKKNATDVKDLGGHINVQETINDNLYSANFEYGDRSLLISFTKNSNTEIESTTYLPGVFTKQ